MWFFASRAFTIQAVFSRFSPQRVRARNVFVCTVCCLNSCTFYVNLGNTLWRFMCICLFVMFVYFLVPLESLEWQWVHFTGVERSRRILSPFFPFVLVLPRVGKMFRVCWWSSCQIFRRCGSDKVPVNSPRFLGSSGIRQTLTRLKTWLPLGHISIASIPGSVAEAFKCR